MPWIDTVRSDFKMALDYFWNSWGSMQSDLLLIVCGPATSWIIDNILLNTGGLYNRVTRRIHLSPFSLSECKVMLQSGTESISDRQVMDYYLVFGGIPYYMNMFDKRQSVAQNVDRLIFDPNGALHNEFFVLFRTLFKNSSIYENVVEMMAKKKCGVTREEILEDEKPCREALLQKY